jgi:hypothetical protein
VLLTGVAAAGAFLSPVAAAGFFFFRFAGFTKSARVKTVRALGGAGRGSVILPLSIHRLQIGHVSFPPLESHAVLMMISSN